MLDADIREPLFLYLETRYGKVRIFEEKNIGTSRADVMAITDGELIGLEIKSDGESYARLKSQIDVYKRQLHRCSAYKQAGFLWLRNSGLQQYQ